MQHEPLEAFMGRIHCDSSKAWHVGVERECLIMDPETGKPAPSSPMLLRILWDEYPAFQKGIGYELSACQIETRTTDPVRISDLQGVLKQREDAVAEVLGRFKYAARYDIIGPPDMTTAYYNDPDGRYAGIVSKRSRAEILAACRIVGTHIHVGMPDLETALRVYNGVIKNLHGLKLAADLTNGERMKLYREVQKNPDPVPFESWDAMHVHAIEHGWSKDLRKNWMLVRITRYGAIEFRFFDGTDSIDQVVSWARECLSLCRGYAH